MKRFASRALAFTLIELLVVIVIIAILAAILLPVIGRVREQADSAKCLNNMRQIANAIASYAGDHDDTLPGPLKVEQFPTFKDDSEGSLPKLLDPYLGKMIGDKGKVSTELKMDERNNPFVCPSYAKLYKKNEVPVFLVNQPKMTAYQRTPWGIEPGEEPVKRALLTAWTEMQDGEQEKPVPLSQVWALIDADEGVLTMKTVINDRGMDNKPKIKLAQKPVHNDHRNVMYFDFHVAKVNVEDPADSERK
jgi:prepilin-type N-terminal cleavage/methylation domain-containing protein/prepilin-type processing-associated H-X9-DG protein